MLLDLPEGRAGFVVLAREQPSGQNRDGPVLACEAWRLTVAPTGPPLRRARSAGLRPAGEKLLR